MGKRNLRRKSQPETGRPFWSGTITFGLVSIPVNLFPASRDSRVSLRMLGPDGEPLKRDYYSAETGKELESSETVRGFETSRGKYVTVTEEELERLAPDKSRDINLRVFVPSNDISRLYFNKGYILTPADKSGKAYRLLAETMEATDRAGVATFVMHGKEYLVAILAISGILRAETLRFHDEIRTPSDIGLPRPQKPSASSVEMFSRAIRRLTKKELDLEEMHDKYAEGMRELIERKHKKHQDVVESAAPPESPAKVVDLMEVLKQSLGPERKLKRAG
jgi:DNA end-binding protein Ku